MKFMDEIFNNEEFEQSIFQDEKTIKPITLYEHYKNWCSSNGERNIVSNTKFGITIDSRIIKSIPCMVICMRLLKLCDLYIESFGMIGLYDRVGTEPIILTFRNINSHRPTLNF